MSNKELILNTLWKTTKIPVLSTLWRFLYWASYQASRLYFLTFSGAKHVYVKGSYVSGSYEPLVSDIDFVLIYSDDGVKTKRRAKLWKKFCPVVQDADCFSEESFYLRRRFGSLKYANLENWRKLDNRFARPAARAAFPLKESFDQAQELFFYWEWTHYNLRQSQSEYRYRCLNRALKKASQLLRAEHKKVKTPLEALTQLDALASQAQRQSPAFKRFSSLVSYDQDEILARGWYKAHFNVYQMAPEFCPNKLNMDQNTFKFFYCLGVIDSTVLLTEIIPREGKGLAAALSIEYYLNIEEGRFNHAHRGPSGNIDITEELELLDHRDSKNELSRFQHLYKLGELKKDITYWFQATFSADLEGDVFARLQNCRSDDLVFTDSKMENNQRSVNVCFFSYDNFPNATLSLTSTFSSFLSFEMNEFLKGEMWAEKEGEATWVAEKKINEIDEKVFSLKTAGNFSNSWHKAVLYMQGLDSPYSVETYCSDGRILSSPRIQNNPNDYMTLYFRPGEDLNQIHFKVFAQERPSYAEVVCFALKED